MKRYIDAELLKKHIDVPDCMIPQASMIHIIDREPTVEIEKHGCWQEYEDVTGEGSNTYKCSECGSVMQFDYDGPKENEFYYCPHCGARLIEVAE